MNFKQPGGTSRGVLREKETYFLILEKEGKQGIGECGLFKGLSADDLLSYESKLQFVCDHIHKGQEWLLTEAVDFPSIQFGVEQAFLSLDSERTFELIPSNFTRGTDAIAINGLIWMGDEQFMKDQIIEKIEAGFTTVKLKIGALDFDTELRLLKFIRNEFSEKDIELRVDA
ncbi:MAG: o-succinylbenzoate synthase, partial [Flavobacteriaceae bacterium]|nr:o-succinylbenzoate synthase [Flavobacteriaceae bacterium]